MSSGPEASSTPVADNPPQANQQANRRNPNRPPRRPKSRVEGETSNSAQNTSQADAGPRRRNPRPRNPPAGVGAEGGGNGIDGAHRQPRRSRPERPMKPHPDHEPSSETSTPAHSDMVSGPAKQPRSRRGAKFGANLTDPSKLSSSSNRNETKPSERYRNAAPKQDDLTSTLIHSLKTSPYPDCLICFSAIHPAQPTWSCSPLIPVSPSDDHTDKPIDGKGADTAQCCWTTFHLKCIRSWASKSVKDVEEAWRARGENRRGEWRCPGCQSKRLVVPGSYWCF